MCPSLVLLCCPWGSQCYETLYFSMNLFTVPLLVFMLFSCSSFAQERNEPWGATPLHPNDVGDAVVFQDYGVFVLSRQVVHFKGSGRDRWDTVAYLSNEFAGASRLEGRKADSVVYLIVYDSAGKRSYFAHNLEYPFQLLELTRLPVVDVEHVSSMRTQHLNPDDAFVVAVDDLICLSPQHWRPVGERNVSVKMSYVGCQLTETKLYYPGWKIDNSRDVEGWLYVDVNGSVVPNPHEEIRIMLSRGRGGWEFDFSWNFVGVFSKMSDSTVSYGMYFFCANVHGVEQFDGDLYVLLDNEGGLIVKPGLFE